jgi:hypothetical protein
MSATTGIEWTNVTWNFLVGCKKTSPGCANCYAIRDVIRMAGNPNPTVSAANVGLAYRQTNGILNWTGVVRMPVRDGGLWLAWQCGRQEMAGSNTTDNAVEETIPTDLFQLLLRLDGRLSRPEELLQEQLRVREYYTTAEVAILLGKAEFTVREWCRLGRVNCRKKNNWRGKFQSWVISHEELLRIQRDGLLTLEKAQQVV